MAAMTTALIEFADNGNSRTYTRTGHTAQAPELCVQSRRVATGNQKVAESKIMLVKGVYDVNSEYLPQKVVFEATVKYPIAALLTDINAELAIFRDIVAGDEFGVTVSTQNWLVL